MKFICKSNKMDISKSRVNQLKSLHNWPGSIYTTSRCCSCCRPCCCSSSSWPSSSWSCRCRPGRLDPSSWPWGASCCCCCPPCPSSWPSSSSSWGPSSEAEHRKEEEDSIGGLRAGAVHLAAELDSRRRRPRRRGKWRKWCGKPSSLFKVVVTNKIDL